MRKMKWLYVLSCMIILAGCGSVSAEGLLEDGSAETQWVTVQATVDKVAGTLLYVQTAESENFPSAYMTLSAALLDDAALVKEGMLLEIICDGQVLETYPAQFGKVSRVKVVSAAEGSNAESDLAKDGIGEKNATETTIESMDMPHTTESEENTALEENIASEDNGTWQMIEVAPPEGSYCTINFRLPEDWDWSCVQTEDVPVSCITIAIWPKAEGDANGSVSIIYAEGFGVCGTGLVSEEVTFNGLDAWRGTYDDHSYWDFISLKEPYRGCAIINNAGGSWFEKYRDEISRILATVTFHMTE